VLEFAATPANADITDLTLPTTCYVDVESLPVQPLPEWADKIEPWCPPNVVAADISDLMKHERAQPPDSLLVGLTQSEVAS
jgi:hypothetical protein